MYTFAAITSLFIGLGFFFACKLRIGKLKNLFVFGIKSYELVENFDGPGFLNILFVDLLVLIINSLEVFKGVLREETVTCRLVKFVQLLLDRVLIVAGLLCCLASC